MTLKQSLVVIEKPLGLVSWTWKAALRRNMRNNNQGLFKFKNFLLIMSMNLTWLLHN